MLAYGWTFYCLFNDSISKHEAGLTVGFYFIVLIAAYIIDRLVYFCCRRSNQIDQEGEKIQDPTFGKTQFSIEDIYEVNLRDQIGLFSKVREIRSKTEYVREFLVSRFENSKV